MSALFSTHFSRMFPDHGVKFNKLMKEAGFPKGTYEVVVSPTESPVVLCMVKYADNSLPFPGYLERTFFLCSKRVTTTPYKKFFLGIHKAQDQLASTAEYDKLEEPVRIAMDNILKCFNAARAHKGHSPQ